MKLGDVVAAAPADHAPSRVVTLPPSAFTDAWTKRPKNHLQVGLRRLSADEHLHAKLEADRLTRQLLPEVDPREDLWLEVFEIVHFHQILAYALTDPRDARKPLWSPARGGAQDAGSWVARATRADSPGDIMIQTRNPSEVIAATRFSSEGFGRLFDEVTVLRMKDSPIWPEADDAAIQRLGAALVDGSMLAKLERGPDAGEGPELVDARHQLASELRRYLGFVIDTHEQGLMRPEPPPTAT